MLREPFFADKQILVVDQPQEHQAKNWCFWEQQKDLFEPIVLHSWPQIDFYSASFSKCFDLAPYSYKMIRSQHLDQYVRMLAAPFTNVHWLNEVVEAIGHESGKAYALAGGRKWEGSYLFNSILFEGLQPQPGKHYLLQHFSGWMIETKTAVFDPSIARLMDFRTTQEFGTAFVYVLPISEQRALVEFTLFSPAVLTNGQYETALRNYIDKELQPGSYRILETERGVIPMTNHRFPRQEGLVIHIGTAGGDTKGSTGYTFRFIQKRTAAIVACLMSGQSLQQQPYWLDKRFDLYDSTLLRVLAHQKMPGDALFAKLFRKNKVQRLLRFLDNETEPLQELSVIASMPATIFLPALLKELFKQLRPLEG